MDIITTLSIGYYFISTYYWHYYPVSVLNTVGFARAFGLKKVLLQQFPSYFLGTWPNVGNFGKIVQSNKN